MIVDGDAFHPQAQRLPVDCGDDLRGHQRVAPQHARKPARIERAFAQRHRSVKQRFVIFEIGHVHAQVFIRRRETPAIALPHRHERRDVEGLVEFEGPVLRRASRSLPAVEHVAVLFAPRGVVDFGNDELERAVGGIEAVVETDRVEAVAEVARVREQADWPAWTHAGVACDAIAHRALQGHLRRAQVLATLDPSYCRALRRPQPMTIEQGREFVEVEIQLADTIAETVRVRQAPLVMHRAFVDAAFQVALLAAVHAAIPTASAKRSHTRSALHTPSS